MKTTSYPGALPPKFFARALYDGVTAQAMANQQNKTMTTKVEIVDCKKRQGKVTKRCVCDFRIVSNGRVLCASKQGYANMSELENALQLTLSAVKSYFKTAKAK